MFFFLGGGLPAWVIDLEQADFLALINRLLPQDYLAPLISPGPGYEIYQAEAAIGARVSFAIANFQAASLIGYAPDGAFAQAVVTFSRPTAAAGAVTIKAGTIVQTTRYGRQFRLMVDVPFGATDLTQPGLVQALFPGEQFNVRGPYTTAGGQVVAGEISQVVSWILSPPYGDATITVAQAGDAQGGQSSVLNIHGADRGIIRAAGELATPFRQRVRSLPETISPNAIQSTIASLSANYSGTTWDFIETWQQDFQTCYDCPSPNAGVPNYFANLPPGLDTNLFVYDDPRPAYPPFRNRWLDEQTYRGAIIVTVPVLACIADYGAPFDDTAETVAALATPNGTRAVPAYDLPNSFSGGLPWAYDGIDWTKNAVYSGLYNSLNRIVAGGVVVDLELQGQ